MKAYIIEFILECKVKKTKSKDLIFLGATHRIRTCGLLLRRQLLYPTELESHISGAGDGNRTHATSLEGWNSTIELHPHGLLPSNESYYTTLRANCQALFAIFFLSFLPYSSAFPCTKCLKAPSRLQQQKLSRL